MWISSESGAIAIELATLNLAAAVHQSHTNWPGVDGRLARSVVHPIFDLADSVDFLQCLGLVAEGLEYPDGEFPSTPCIAVMSGKGASSVQVITRVSDEVHLVCSARGPLKRSKAAFLAEWTRIAITASAPPGWHPPDRRTEWRERQRRDHLTRMGVQLWPGFLADDECRQLADLAEAFYRRSLVNEGLIDDGRTSQSAVVRDEVSPLVPALRERAARRLDKHPSQVETLQCVAYDVGQYVYAHYDAFDDIEPTNGLSQRSTTVLVYLNDDFEGGETRFPALDLSIRPRQGTALVFPNIAEDGMVLRASLHESLPVRAGRKVACNLWVRGGSIDAPESGATPQEVGR